jgi:peroxiredoxin
MDKPTAEHLDAAVDESSRESFPASDSPAVHAEDAPPVNAQAQWRAATTPADGGRGANPRPSAPLAPGAPAPPFSLPSSPSESAALAEHRGRPVVLVFYPADWSPVCGDQLALYTELQDEFARLGAQVLGISVDGPWCHAAFRSARKYAMPLLADFEPKGAVARSYGVYSESTGTAERALFVLDAHGIVRWSYVSPIGVNPGADGILKALETLRAGES